MFKSTFSFRTMFSKLTKRKASSEGTSSLFYKSYWTAPNPIVGLVVSSSNLSPGMETRIVRLPAFLDHSALPIFISPPPSITSSFAVTRDIVKLSSKSRPHDASQWDLGGISENDSHISRYRPAFTSDKDEDRDIEESEL